MSLGKPAASFSQTLLKHVSNYCNGFGLNQIWSRVWKSSKIILYLILRPARYHIICISLLNARWQINTCRTCRICEPSNTANISVCTQFHTFPDVPAHENRLKVKLSNARVVQIYIKIRQTAVKSRGGLQDDTEFYFFRFFSCIL